MGKEEKITVIVKSSSVRWINFTYLPVLFCYDLRPDVATNIQNMNAIKMYGRKGGLNGRYANFPSPDADDAISSAIFQNNASAHVADNKVLVSQALAYSTNGTREAIQTTLAVFLK